MPRSLGGRTTWSIRTESGGASVFDLSGGGCSGPPGPAAAVLVHFERPAPGPADAAPDRPAAPLGPAGVHLLRDDRSITRPRAAAVVPFNRSLRGPAGTPGPFATRPCGPRRSPPAATPWSPSGPTASAGCTGAGTAGLRGVRHRPRPGLHRLGQGSVATTGHSRSGPCAAPTRWSSATAPGWSRRSARPRRRVHLRRRPSGATLCPGSRAAPTTRMTEEAAPTATRTSAGPGR